MLFSLILVITNKSIGFIEIENAILVILPIVLSVFIWKYQKEKERRIDLEKQLSESKYIVYNDIINVFMTYFQ